VLRDFNEVDGICQNLGRSIVDLAGEPTAFDFAGIADGCLQVLICTVECRRESLVAGEMAEGILCHVTKRRDASVEDGGLGRGERDLGHAFAHGIDPDIVTV
jgi:hypothetical protein